MRPLTRLGHAPTGADLLSASSAWFAEKPLGPPSELWQPVPFPAAGWQHLQQWASFAAHCLGNWISMVKKSQA